MIGLTNSSENGSQHIAQGRESGWLPPRLTLVDNIEHDYKNDPSLWEIRAAANASRGDCRAAVKAEAKAISGAGGSRLGFGAIRAGKWRRYRRLLNEAPAAFCGPKTGLLTSNARLGDFLRNVDISSGRVRQIANQWAVAHTRSTGP